MSVITNALMVCHVPEVLKKKKKRKGLGNICLHQMLSIAWFGVLNLLKKYFLDYILKSER